MSAREETMREVKMYQSNDWDIKEETPEYFLLTRSESTMTGHVMLLLFTGWWTLGLANIVYYFAKKKTKKIIK